MKIKLITTALVMTLGLAASASAATLSFSFVRPGQGGTWNPGAVVGDNTASAAGTNNTSWTTAVNAVDIFGDGNLYDVTMTADITLAGFTYNSGSTRWQSANSAADSTLVIDNVNISFANNTGSSGTVDASLLSATFNGFVGLTSANVGAGEQVDITGSAVGGGSITPVTVSNNNNEGAFTFDAASELTFTQVSGNIYFFGANGSWDVSAVPEPSSAALLGLGGIVLLLRRRK